MGKYPPLYTDTETDNTSSSVEALKKKRKPSILKHTGGAVKKKKCKMHSRSEPEDSDVRGSRSRSRTNSKKKEVKGILKQDREKERYYSSSCEDEEEKEEVIQKCRDSRCLIGRVARPAGYKPGRGGGLSLIVKKNIKNEDNNRAKQVTSSSSKKSRGEKRLFRKTSF